MRIYELLSNLLIVLLSAMGFMRGIEFVIRGESSMQNASNLYIVLSQYIDIQSLGWLLATASLVLLASVFTQNKTAFVLMTIGGLVCGSVHFFYGLVAVEGAKVISTYYTSLTIGIYQYLLCGVGVISLWKIKKNKD